MGIFLAKTCTIIKSGGLDYLILSDLLSWLLPPDFPSGLRFSGGAGSESIHSNNVIPYSTVQGKAFQFFRMTMRHFTNIAPVAFGRPRVLAAHIIFMTQKCSVSQSWAEGEIRLLRSIIL